MLKKVNNLFSNCDAKAILAIPIPKNQDSDRIAQTDTVNGKCTVKSGYSFWHKHYSECRQVSIHKGWAKLWNLEVPNKVKVFLWRLCKNNVPVRNLLRGRGVQTTIICPMCGSDVEHLLHIFLDCNFAKNVGEFWEQNLTHQQLNLVRNGCFKVWLQKHKKGQCKWLWCCGVFGRLDT